MVTQGKTVRSARGRFASRKSNSTPQKQATLGIPLTISFATSASSDIASDGNALSTSRLSSGADLSAGRPPSKLAVTQPYGTLQQTIDGATTDLKIAHGEKLSASDASLLGLKLPSRASPNPNAQAKEKRVLRSQDGGPRTRSDLAHFFPDYEEVVFGAPKVRDYINPESTLFIVEKKDKNTEVAATRSTTLDGADEDAQAAVISRSDTNNGASLETVVESVHIQEPDIANFDSAKAEADQYEKDPLSENYYLKAHRRGERREKQLRNIEKEHAMHEKLDLDRLFEELQGPDWLKTMGLAGFVDGDKRSFESKRDYYINAIRALLDKFRSWKDQERELKARKEAAIAAQLEEDEEGDDHDETSLHRFSIDDADLSALQLRQEAGLPPRVPLKKIKLRLNFALPEEDPTKPFVSFYSNPHLRAAALGSHRRGRNPTAFGQSVPDFKEAEFALPDDYITEEIVTANARKRRRLKRESKV